MVYLLKMNSGVPSEQEEAKARARAPVQGPQGLFWGSLFALPSAPPYPPRQGNRRGGALGRDPGLAPTVVGVAAVVVA